MDCVSQDASARDISVERKETVQRLGSVIGSSVAKAVDHAPRQHMVCSDVTGVPLCWGEMLNSQEKHARDRVSFDPCKANLYCESRRMLTRPAGVCSGGSGHVRSRSVIETEERNWLRHRNLVVENLFRCNLVDQQSCSRNPCTDSPSVSMMPRTIQ